MNAETPITMVRHVCAGFEDAPFSLVDAARRMIQLYPLAPPEAFTEGWEALLLRRELVPAVDAMGKFRLQAPAEVARHLAQSKARKPAVLSP